MYRAGLCDQRGIPAPTLPPVESAVGPDDLHAQTTGAEGAMASADDGEEEDEHDDEDDSDGYGDDAADDDFMFEEVPASPAGRVTRTDAAEAAPAGADSSPALKRLKLSGGKVDEYTLYQKFGRAKPPPPATTGDSAALTRACRRARCRTWRGRRRA